jgi:hypothetical protein
MQQKTAEMSSQFRNVRGIIGVTSSYVIRDGTPGKACRKCLTNGSIHEHRAEDQKTKSYATVFLTLILLEEVEAMGKKANSSKACAYFELLRPFCFLAS